MSANQQIFRAGIIPFIRKDDIIQFMFMKPSDPKFGGPDWQIAKGRVEDEDIDNFTAALREGSEELGLKKSNIKNVVELGVFLGRTSIFLCEVYDKQDFAPFHYETGDVIWMTMKEFELIGRKLHLDIVRKAYDITMAEME